ncbi:MAG: hypothetical protein KatS3mg094_044 [Candidatus Parcubacteria bacterium]|nr:MAG: hypothetical protein KatS3mg094_044 [Candidatus Parcubacteria bacterium]
MNKKLIYILIGGSLIILISGGFLFYLKNKSIEYPAENQTQQEIQNQPISNSNIVNQITNSSELTTSTPTEKTEEKFYTMEEIVRHNSKENCWTVIRGEVYDLTQWIDKHPGGADEILSLCGKDGTQGFERKHGGEERPEKALEGFEIGKLKQ